MDTNQTGKLKALALAAENAATSEDQLAALAEFNAAANPATVLELCNENTDLRAEVERLRAEVEEWLCTDCNTVYPGPPQAGFACVMCPKCSGTTMPRQRAEVEKLRVELASRGRAEGGDTRDFSFIQKFTSERYGKPVASGSAPAAGTDKDAEDAARYRWLRQAATFGGRDTCDLRWYLPRFGEGDTRERLDAAIDAVIVAGAHTKAGKPA